MDCERPKVDSATREDPIHAYAGASARTCRLAITNGGGDIALDCVVLLLCTIGVTSAGGDTARDWTMMVVAILF